MSSATDVRTRLSQADNQHFIGIRRSNTIVVGYICSAAESQLAGPAIRLIDMKSAVGTVDMFMLRCIIVIWGNNIMKKKWK